MERSAIRGRPIDPFPDFASLHPGYLLLAIHPADHDGWGYAAGGIDNGEFNLMRVPMSSQAVGAYGEKIVEAELLRRGWLPANVNATVKNAAEFDILAQKEGRIVCLRVKTCGIGQRAFIFYVPIGEKSSGA
jgi:hypothetical protein